MMNGTRFWQMKPAPVMGMNRRNIEMVMSKNERKDFPIANNKLLTKSILSSAGLPVAPTIATFESFYEIGRFEKNIEKENDFVIKPARGSGGNGILVIAEKKKGVFRTAGGRILTTEDIVRHVADVIFGVFSFDKADAAMLEPRLVPDDFFSSLYPYGLSDMRLLLVENRLEMAMIRVPTRDSDGRANLHQGAIGIAVDVSNGRTYRAWHRRKAIAVHPETQLPLLSLVVPQWKRIKEIAIAASTILPLNFLGVDMVVDRTIGPLVLEVNARPGIEIQNVTGRSLPMDPVGEGY